MFMENWGINMKKINWKTRIKHKTFWVGIISALFVFAQSILPLFGVNIDLAQVTQLQGSTIDAINSVFSILAILGIVVDPTTAGFKDSDTALTYNEPRKSEDTTEVLG